MSPSRALVLLTVGMNEAEERRLFVHDTWTTNPADAPGYYETAVLAENIGFEQSVEKEGDTVAVDQTWTVEGPEGESLAVTLAFSTAVPNISPAELFPFSSVNLEKSRHYVVRQRTVGVPAAGADISISAQGDVLGELLGASSEVILVTYTPFFSRKTFVEVP